MPFRRKPPNPALVVVFTLIGLTGCTPPAVDSLLTVADRVLIAEDEYVRADLADRLDSLAASRRTLANAFNRDLDEAEAVDRQWIKEAAEAYASTREAIARSESQAETNTAVRRDNLSAARQAIDRARVLLRSRDDLLTRPLRVIENNTPIESVEATQSSIQPKEIAP